MKAKQIARRARETVAHQPSFAGRDAPAPCEIFGQGLEEGALQQMRNACQLTVAVAGALMPDAHQGYGLPIGGVLATDNAVIPYAVGVDIACRMKMTVLERPISDLETKPRELISALEGETRFGVGATFRGRRQHAVMDEDWSVSSVTASLKDRAWSQLGTSGSGNHFVEFGVLTVRYAALGLAAGSTSRCSATRVAAARGTPWRRTSAAWPAIGIPSCRTRWRSWLGSTWPRTRGRSTGRRWS